jgi:hypothetical protein
MQENNARPIISVKPRLERVHREAIAVVYETRPDSLRQGAVAICDGRVPLRLNGRPVFHFDYPLGRSGIVAKARQVGKRLRASVRPTRNEATRTSRSTFHAD